MRILSLLIMIAAGIAFVQAGRKAWINHDLSALNKNRYANVAPENLDKYLEIVGKATIIIGVGICGSGIVNFIFGGAKGWIVAFVAMGAGMGMMFYAQTKYNRWKRK